MFSNLINYLLLVDNFKKFDYNYNDIYKGAKIMYLVSDIDNSNLLKDIVLDTYEGLKVIK